MKKNFKSMDGNEAAALSAYAFTELAGIYPITPSTPLGEHTDAWAAQGKKNLFGMPAKVVEMQSEAGAAGAVHGSLQSGALTTTFTASQGLLLKIPEMYKWAGQLLPAVMHVAARSIATQALSIFGDHQDVMAARQTGVAMLSSGSVQEGHDLAGVAHLSAIKSSVPFMHFFDGFRTSHEIQKIELTDYSLWDRLLDRDAVAKFRARATNSSKPNAKGSAQNDDVYFQATEASNKYFDAVPGIVAKYMEEVSKETGREYKLFKYYGAEDATDVIIAMGSVTETIRQTIDHLAKEGRKVGLLSVHLYRPFSIEYFLDAMPKSVNKIAVLDRTKERGSIGEPLYLDIQGVYYGKENAPLVIGGRYGLSSKDTTPGQIISVYDNLAGEAKNNFTIGINDDITYLSLDSKEVDITKADTTECLFYGLGADGTVGANKNSIKIIGDNTDLYAQAYFAYDSKKSGGVTRSHLRFGPRPIRATYLVTNPSFVSCSNDAYLDLYDMLGGLKQGGTFLLNTVRSAEEIDSLLPNYVKKQLAEKEVKFYIIDAISLAREIGLGKRTNTIMQSAFFKLNEQIMKFDTAQDLMKSYAKKLYSKKGDAIVELNYKAIDRGANGLQEITVDPSWANLEAGELKKPEGDRPEFITEISDKINAIKGYDIPVSTFEKEEFVDGSIMTGSTAYEKRGVASFVPKWIEENCIQCNQCAFVCPHAVIRPFLSTEEETGKAPEGTRILKPVGKGLDGLSYSIQVSTLDCTGCEVCVNACPGKKGVKALEMVPIGEAIEDKQHERSEYFFNEVTYKDDLVGKTNAKNVQFAKPYFEFSGACAGCGETPYISLVTRLFGNRMVIANATGCSSIYGGSYPVTPYTNDSEGRGTAWVNSLFEDNAELGFGMHMANETLRDRLQNIFATGDINSELKELGKEWIENRKDGEKTLELSKKMSPLLKKAKTADELELFNLEQYIVKQSQWILGGDGWAYDIGYGGLDHVIANNEDVNILVMDTEVYSNTGGQSSKSSQTGSIAKFTAGGKKANKKDLAAIAMSYGHVYVAQVSHGASQAQVLKAFKEAEAHPGPSIILAYSPCIAHGIKGGLGVSQIQAKLATECGYWPTFRYNPALEAEGKNPLKIDSKQPVWDKYIDFLMTENRYGQLSKVNPEEATKLLELNRESAKRRWRMYERYTEMDFSK